MAPDSNFTLLDTGEDFRGYKVLRMLNKDKEGIKYIAERDGKEYILKIFHQSSFHTFNTLYDLQMLLFHLKELDTPYTPKVREIDQSNDPAYMAVEFVRGISLAEIKRHDPQRLDEKMVRQLLPQLIEAAIAIHKQGLSISELTLHGIMLDDNDKICILTSGIQYQEADELEEVFSIGMIAAQLLSPSPRYLAMYSDENLRQNKFKYIGGISMDLNKIIADCLHRNITQRYKSLDKLARAVAALPDLQGADICEKANVILTDEGVEEKVVVPLRSPEYGFWALVIVVIAAIVLLFTTGLYDRIFGGEEAGPGDSSFAWGLDSEVSDSLGSFEGPAERSDVAPILTPYGELRSTGVTGRDDPRRLPAVPRISDSSPKPVITKSQPNKNFVYIQPSTFGLGRLGENLAHNVSLSGFYISKYEVTQAEWNRFMKPAQVSNIGDNLPVDNVSWFDIAIYCNGLSQEEGLQPAYRIKGIGASRIVTCDFGADGYRLPTEAEWELAAKAGELHNYSGSADPEDVAWYRDNSAGKLRQPGGKAPNDFGLYDMTGNVSEWVWDWFATDHIRELDSFVNPTGPQTGTQKVIRGGNVMNSAGRNLNIMWRERGNPNKGYPFVGFRLVRTK